MAGIPEGDKTANASITHPRHDTLLSMAGPVSHGQPHDDARHPVQLLTGDYLEHRDLYATLKTLLLERAAKGALSLADLGCGDSDYISRTLGEAGGSATVCSYTGVDLSEPAIDISRRNIAKCACEPASHMIMG